jgi:hypothetical protein
MKPSKNTIANTLLGVALLLVIVPFVYISSLYHRETDRKTVFISQHNCKVFETSKNFTYFNWEDNKIETAAVRIKYVCQGVDGPIVIRDKNDDQ